MRFPRKKTWLSSEDFCITSHDKQKMSYIPGIGRKKGDVYVTNIDQLHLPVFHT